MATISTRGRNAGGALVFLLGAAVFLNYVDRGAIGIASPLMKGELGLSEETYGIAFSAFFWIYAPVQLFAGWLCDRFSVYKLMAGGILLWAGSTFLDGLCRGVRLAACSAHHARHRRKHFLPGQLEDHCPACRARAARDRQCRRRRRHRHRPGGRHARRRPDPRAVGLARDLFRLRGRDPAVGAAVEQTVRELPTTGHHDDGARVPVAQLLAKWPLWSMSIVHALGNYCFYFLLAWLPLFLTKSRGFSIGEMTLLATLGYAVQGACALGYGISPTGGPARAGPKPHAAGG